MPEYLSPGVYVEELETGPQPIEGVSTSTAGFIGMTERGPVNVPILITSPGDYANWFGGLLNREDFIDPADPDRAHCYLPYSVLGFLTNGGQRAYVMRVLPDEATKAHRFMFNSGLPGDPATMLLRTAREGTGTTAPLGLFVLNSAGIVSPKTVRIGDGSASEYIDVGSSAAATDYVTLDQAIRFAHASGAAVNTYAPTVAGGPYDLVNAVIAGGTQLIVNSPVDNLSLAPPAWVKIVTGGSVEYVAVTPPVPAPIGFHFTLTLKHPLIMDHPAGQVFAITMGAATAHTLETDATGGDSLLFLTPAATVGDVIEIEPASATAEEVRIVGNLGELTFAQPANEEWTAGTTIAQVSFAASVASTTTTADAAAGARVISLASRESIDIGTVLCFGTAPGEEYATVVAVTGARTFSPDPGSVVLSAPLDFAFPSGTAILAYATPTVPAVGNPSAHVLFDVAAGSNQAIVSWGQGWALNQVVSVTTPDGEVSYHRLQAAPALAPIAGLTPGLVLLTAPLQRTHAIGSPVTVRESLFTVEALDAGAWGRRLYVSVQDEQPGLVSRSHVVSVAPPFQIKVSSLTGIEPGSYLELFDPTTMATIDPATPLKVRSVDRSSTTVRFDTALSLAQISAIGLAPPSSPIGVRSREFSMTVMLYRQPDAAVPSRNEQIIQSEVFRYLSMDHRHSHYIETVIGATDGPPSLEDGRPKGGSMLIRVKDVATTPADKEAPRLGPEDLWDHMPGGLMRAARFELDQDGDDSIGTVSDAIYIGMDDPEPANRTGIPALRNVPQISIVAVPGQGSPMIQSALIAHCEASMFRFAVLDPESPDDSLADIQQQRQAFDSKYAAIYYPWLSIPDPMPDNLSSIKPFPIPPSGHVVGIYARVDDQRGVHKAPANEVVLGITDVTRKLYKGEQDILNPEPVNINVIRDFRSDGRSIRVWGARCITQDREYKYVPVRRLTMFIEQSIDLGLQWVVFEPNAQPLWSRVTRSVINFLTTVWRSGALEGSKPEEAFFVKCGPDTMTQDDMDNGRLIVVIGIAPVKPAEFVIIRIGLTTASSSQ